MAGMAKGASAAEGAERLRAMIAGARLIAGFTGAGISTESGVPDYRSPGSPWRRGPPVTPEQFQHDPLVRAEVWRRKFAMDDLYRGARPSRGHRALAALVREGRMPAVITQNIDGLHQASGIPDAQVHELHGNTTYARCLCCGARAELGPIREYLESTGEAPACHFCGGVVRTATVGFGQKVPEAALRASARLALACDLFLVVGSSLVVRPAASLPVLAKRHGARLVILNREPTPLDELADLVVHAEIGPTLGPLWPGDTCLQKA